MTQSPASSDFKAGIAAACADSGGPVTLSVPETCAGPKVLCGDIANVEITVSDALAARGFPFPRLGDPRVTQADFPPIVAAIRAANATEFGPDADRPD